MYHMEVARLDLHLFFMRARTQDVLFLIARFKIPNIFLKNTYD